MTSFEGDTGPYLQYAHARLCSITRKAGLTTKDIESADLSLLTEPHAINLVRLLASWPDMVARTLSTLEPITILAYLFKMTHMLSSSYDVLKVIGSETELKKARMALYEAARQVLNNGMHLLGLNPVERQVISSPSTTFSADRIKNVMKIGTTLSSMTEKLRWMHYQLYAYGEIPMI